MPKPYYSTKQVAELIGASSPAIRNYTAQYARHLSTEATPPPGQVRRFTPDDVRLLAFIYTATTDQNLTHDQVAELLESGELEHFEWEIESPETAQEGQEAQESTGTALVPVERLQAAMTLLEDARRREDAAREQTEAVREEAKQEQEALRDELARLRQELGEARGELNAYRKMQPRRPRWWVWLFGGSESEG